MEQQSSIRSKWPELALLHHIKNETREGAKQIAIDKAIGVKKGVPDLSLPVPRGRYHGLYIEMKNDAGGPPKNRNGGGSADGAGIPMGGMSRMEERSTDPGVVI